MKPTKILSFLLCIFLSLLTLQSNAKTTSKYYGPAQEELIGVIKKLTFPGPPNYEDIKKGDLDETCPYLILDYPIDVFTKQSIPTDSQLPYADEKHVQIVQLAIGKKSLWKLMKDGKRVKVRGELYEAHTGHHHTRVLMLVEDAQTENSKSNFAFKNARIQCEPDHGFCEVEYR